MNRRDFLKSALTVAALAPFSRLASRLGAETPLERGQMAQVTRRRYKNTDLTLPLLGFGLMRLPEQGGRIDKVAAQKMFDLAMEAGCNYFDTAWMYHGGESESFLGEALAKYPRTSYMVTSKMPIVMLKNEADVERIFNEQLRKTRVGYFDFYFMHWLSAEHWDIARKFKVYDFMKRKQAEGKIRRIGFSYHGDPQTLEIIAKALPWELAQIQLNYLDWEQNHAREQYEILTKLGIPVAVMTPLKGGTLATLSPAARRVFEKVNPDASIASWGLRFAASPPNVAVVLSGMSDMSQMQDNIKTFSPFKPLTDAERRVIASALRVYRNADLIPCTGCRYCMPCPVGVEIPANLAIYNNFKESGDRAAARKAYTALPEEQRASECVQCGVCRKKCPQTIDIPALMPVIADAFK